MYLEEINAIIHTASKITSSVVMLYLLQVCTIYHR